MFKYKTVIPILILISLFGCSDLIVRSTDKNYIGDFEKTWEVVNSVYPLLEYKKINWDSLYTVYRPRIENAKGDETQLIICELLKELKDAHVYAITPGGGKLTPYIPPRLLKDKDAYHPAVVRKYFNKELKLACLNSVEYEILTDNIGYMAIAHFNGDNQLDDFPKVMEYLKNTKSLIIDIRGNSGGSSSNYDSIVSRFIDTPLEYLPTYTKGEVPWTWGAYPIDPNQNYYSYSNPVVILINGASLSGGDIFPELMKKLDNVTVIGDTTAGAAASDYGDDDIHGEFKLDCGLIIGISTVHVMRNDGLPLEWNGVLPDIQVTQTAGDINKMIDKQLEYAFQLLNKN